MWVTLSPDFESYVTFQLYSQDYGLGANVKLDLDSAPQVMQLV